MKVRSAREKQLFNFELPLIASIVLMTVWFERFLWTTAVMIAFWALVRLLIERRLAVRTQADWAVGLMAIVTVGTLLVSIDRSVTLQQVYRLVASFGLFYAVANWVSTRQRIWLSLGIIALTGIGLAIIAPFSVAWSTSKIPLIPSGIYDQFRLLTSDSVHRNVFAGTILLPLAVAIAGIFFAWYETRLSIRILFMLSVPLSFGMFVLAQSRGALIGLGVVFMLLIGMRFRYGWTLMPTALIGFGILIYRCSLAPILEFMASGVSLEGVEGRIEIWARAIYMIQDFPVTGIGMGLFGPIADLLYPFFVAPAGSVPHAHNLFLQIAIDLGLPGLVAWLAIFLLVLHESWQLFVYGRANGSGLAAALGAGLFTSQVGLAVHGLFDAVVWGMVRVSPIVWGLWGLAFASGNVLLIAKKKNGEPDEQHDAGDRA